MKLIHCKTREEYIAVAFKAKADGVDGVIDKDLTGEYWGKHKEETVFVIKDNNCAHCYNKEHYQDVPIITAQEYLDPYYGIKTEWVDSRDDLRIAEQWVYINSSTNLNKMNYAMKKAFSPELRRELKWGVRYENSMDLTEEAKTVLLEAFKETPAGKKAIDDYIKEKKKEAKK